MGHIDVEALRSCVRDTLETFLADHDGLEFAEVQVLETASETGACDLTVDGHRFTVMLV